MPRRPRETPAQVKARLARDLSGAPIPFRRVPTPSGVRSREYYNPYTGDVVSEHYVVRVYTPALKKLNETELARSADTERARARYGLPPMREITEDERAVRRKFRLEAKERISTLADSYTAKQQSAGLEVDPATFRTLVNQLTVVAFNARQAPKFSEERANLYAADGDYAALLVTLGRRNEDDPFPVGMSPKGWASTVAVNLLSG